MLRLLLAFVFLAMPVMAEEVVLGKSRDEIDITATFNGAEILLFGAIKREVGPLIEGDLGVIVTVAGPDQPVTVRRKDKKLGIWVNAASVDIDIAPTFYAVATNAPLADILAESEDINTRITINRAIRSVGPAEGGSTAFIQSLIRIREANNLYQTLEGSVNLTQDTLFQTRITLPANLTEGEYKTEIYLTRNGQIVDLYTTSIPVQKVGLERWLYNLAHENAFLYGLMSLAIAIAAGWSASAVFSLIRQ
ncbi:TIGR02186 family protein [Ascidiaceihabitans sp.]|uniref:TIGR02186 family protein n=1 Tax=Ascidiaceihabitans sp. TaxID=1872644 RepID=UPI0032988F8A